MHTRLRNILDKAIQIMKLKLNY